MSDVKENVSHICQRSYIDLATSRKFSWNNYSTEMGKGPRNQGKKLAKSIKKIAQKKLLATYTLDELLEKVQNEIDVFNYTEAQMFCQEALKRDPDNVRVLETSSSLCIETGNIDSAKHCLGRAITLAPENGFSKYLSMGQLLEGKDSLQCYLKGIELIYKFKKGSEENQNHQECKDQDKKLDKLKEVTEDEDMKDLTETKMGNTEVMDNNSSISLDRKLSNAYCAVAELFMSDLCDDDNAESESLSNIQKAIAADSTNPEALLHYANFLLIKDNVEEAKDNIKKSVSLWLPKYKEVENGEASAGSFDPVDVCPLTQSVRLLTTRILIEVEEHELAEDVLEGLLGEDEEVVYTWYLLGWNHFLQEAHKVEAKQHFERALQLHKACPSPDVGIIEHMKELMEELKDVKLDEDEGLEAESEIEVFEDQNEIEDLERDVDEMDIS